MKNIFTLLFLVFSITLVNAQSKYIKGKLTFLDAPLANADITIGTETKVKSGADGSYAISTEIGDVISYSYHSLKTVEIIVEDVTSILNITMSPAINQLDEVVVKSSKRGSQNELEEDYLINKKIIRTAFGFLNAERGTGKVNILNEDQIFQTSNCILDIIRSRFAGVVVVGTCTGATEGNVFLSRTTNIVNNGAVTWDVDGQIFTNNTFPFWVNVGSIRRIAILQSLSATFAYGNLGNTGVVVINTFGNNIGRLSGKLLDRALLRNNKYEDDALTANQVVKNQSNYLSDYQASVTIAAAKSVYENNFKKYYNAPHFFIDSYAYFMDRGEKEFAMNILNKNSPLFDRNAVYMKAFAYYSEVNDALEKAKDLYEKAFILRPNYAQSYRDLAESYRDIKNYRKAVSIYARYNNLVEEGFLQSDGLGFGSIIDRDSENLLTLRGDKIFEGVKRIKPLLKHSDFNGTRLLFEWNDSEAEFELQFVNPDKRYYIWKHNYQANADRITDEKLKGYSLEEFLVDGSLAGKWQVNVNYQGNKKLGPTYLKVTTYSNYGQASQRKQVNVYRLGLKNVNQKLFDLNNSSVVSTN